MLGELRRDLGDRSSEEDRVVSSSRPASRSGHFVDILDRCDAMLDERSAPQAGEFRIILERDDATGELGDHGRLITDPGTDY